jgi:ABC-2 type transport system ATP-binding protein
VNQNLRQEAQRQDSALEVHDLAKSYRRRPALRGVSFSVSPGEIFTLVGPNGSGKTTTVEILEGIRRHDGGSFQVLGGQPADRRVREEIGVQLQDAQVMENLRPVEVLRLFRSFYPRGLRPEEALDRVSLSPPRRTLVRELSGGQQKRLLIALAIVNDPRLVFLDEPTTGLDPAVRREVWEIIRDLGRRGTAVLFTTHYLDEAERLSDRVAILDRGRIVALGTPGELIGSSGLPGHLDLTLDRVVPELAVRIASGFPGSSVNGASARLPTLRVEEDLHRLFELCREHSSRVREIAVHTPTLEDVFLARTGSSWPGEGEAG